MDYKNSKIYTIRSPQTDKYYIGATTQPLSKRFSRHKTYKFDGNKCASTQIIDLGDAYIELLEMFPCETKEQLSAREFQLIREHKANLVNIVGMMTAEEKREKKNAFSREYRKRPEVKEQSAEWKKEYMKQYSIDNREKINAQLRERRRLAKENLA
jgi:hypothetical protein